MINIYHHFPTPLVVTPAAHDEIGALIAAVADLKRSIDRMSATQSQLDAAIAALQAEVAADTSATQSAVTLMNAIPRMIADAVAQASAAGATPEQLSALNELSAALQANTASLAAAVAADGPAPAPAPAPEPTPPAA